jgi:hypothetical protein
MSSILLVTSFRIHPLQTGSVAIKEQPRKGDGGEKEVAR